MMAILDISRAESVFRCTRADAIKAKRMVSRGMLREGKPYEVIGDTQDMYIKRHLIIKDELGQAQILHKSMLVPYDIWLAEKREERISDLGI